MLDVPNHSDDVASNPSTEPSFRQIMQVMLARRGVLRGLAGAATLAATPLSVIAGAGSARAEAASTLTFTEIPHGPKPDDDVAPGYQAEVVIAWGDPLLPEAPAFDVDKQTPATQASQFGYNNDYQAFMPLPLGSVTSDHGLMWVNHEYAEGSRMFPPVANPSAELRRQRAEIEQQAVGGSVVEIIKENGRWTYKKASSYNRRITMATPMSLSGPAAGHARLQTSADPTGRIVLGTYGNCAGGMTPWGTIITAEENFNAAFSGMLPAGSSETGGYQRLGIGTNAVSGWGLYFDRFNVTKEPNEANRFGWLVEVDPYDPNSTPVKRTALGRVKHEGGAMHVAPDGRVVVYTGDDQVNEYLYRFVTQGTFNPTNREANRELLDTGVLSVAKFNANGTLDWLPMVHGQGPLTPANGFSSQADVVIDARLAATLLGATPMDRPEDVEPSPTTGKVYMALTNNATRTAAKVDAANPRPNNRFGHIMEMTPPDNSAGKPDPTAASFTWDIFILAGNPEDPAHGARYGGPITSNGWFAAPDNVAFDSRGRLWIASDQGTAQQTYGIGDGMWACDCEGSGRAITKFFYRTPTGGEMCGPVFTPDDRTLFVAVQHPGSDDSATTWENPTTRWPDFAPGVPARPAMVAITKLDGGIIGS